MSSRKYNRREHHELNSGSSRNDRTPSQFKCKIGGEWKPSEQFSKNQIAKWHNAKRGPNSRVTPENCGLACREHSGEPALQLQCEGKCRRFLSKEKFSNSQRRNGGRVCKDCIGWIEQQEARSIPGAYPNGDVSIDEQWIGSIVDEDQFVTEVTDDEESIAAHTQVYTAGYPASDSDDSDDFREPGDDALMMFPTQAPPRSNASVTTAGSNLGFSSVASTDGSTIGDRSPAPQRRAVTPNMAILGSASTPTRRMPNSASTMNANRGRDRIGSRPPASVASSDTRTAFSSFATASQFSGSQLLSDGLGSTTSRTGPRIASVQDVPEQTAKPDRNGWARPPMRKKFTTQIDYSTPEEERIDVQSDGEPDDDD